MSPKPSPASPAHDSARPYREVTVAAMVLGGVFGVVLTAAMTYAGLVIGFVVPASAIAAILGWGVLRGIMRRGTIVENNIVQTVSSAVNNASAGVIFTFPALFLMDGIQVDPWPFVIASVAGAFLGTLFIIPLRKQMIELERLRFPWGIAVAELLRSPGSGARKSLLLLVSMGAALAFGLLVSFGMVPTTLDIGGALGIPRWIPAQIALSLLSVGAGYITGRPGLVVLAGGVLACWVTGPLVVALEWAPGPNAPELAAVELGAMLHSRIYRPLGIGFLAGGALAGVLLALPMLRAAFRSLKGARLDAGQELPISLMIAGLVGAFALLGGSAYMTAPEIGIGRAVMVALVGAIWIWLAGIIVAQCSGMTGWSPISGLALLAVSLVLLMTNGAATLAVLIGAAVCVAIGQGADMVGDLKTGYLVGARPLRQQLAQLSMSWLGPPVAVATVYLIWTTMGFGPDQPSIPAPQAATLQGMIEAFGGQEVPADKYLVGGLIGALLTLATGGGLGVLVGLSMYLPLFYVLPYGAGCVLAIVTDKRLGRRWTLDVGVPVAAGLLVGDSLSGVVFALVRLGASLGGAS